MIRVVIQVEDTPEALDLQKKVIESVQQEFPEAEIVPAIVKIPPRK